MVLVVLVVAAVVAESATACSDGQGGDSSLAGVRVVEIVMKEMSFSPNRIDVTVGEVVRFRFINKGTVRHEAVIGDQAAQDAAVAQMRNLDSATSTTAAPATSAPSVTVEPATDGASSVELVAAHLRAHPGMGLPNVVSVEAGGTGELTFSFAKAGTLLIDCHEPGHLEGGMTGIIVVKPAAGT